MVYVSSHRSHHAELLRICTWGLKEYYTVLHSAGDQLTPLEAQQLSDAATTCLAAMMHLRVEAIENGHGQ